MNRTFVPALAMLACAPLAAMAQDAGDQKPGRYVLERTDDGILRMDTVTGEMSVCGEKAGRVVCKLPADERQAVDEQIDELEARIAVLEMRLDTLEKGGGGEAKALPSDEELDQAFNMMEKFIYRFFDVFKDLDRRENDAEPPAGDMPHKT
jgi:hypothetical protein